MIRLVRRKSPLSIFFLGVLLTFGLQSMAVFAADESISPPCPAGGSPAGPSTAETQPPDPPEVAPSTADLRFSEFLPNPAGTDTEGEFIEIENPSDAVADISNWRITDAKGKSYAIPAMSIAAHGSRMFIYAETKIPLVNVASGYALHDASGLTVDSVAYPEPVPEGKSYARFEGGWRWTETPTPGNANVFSETSSAPAPIAPTPMPAPEVPPPVIPETPAAPVAPPEPINMIIDEFLPNPDGDDAVEWIELRNAGVTDASLGGWSLDDADGGSMPYVFANEVVPAGERFIAHRSSTRIALNNDADEVRLIAPDGSVRQRIRYENAPSGKSFATDGANWQWTSPTPGEANVFEYPLPPAETTTDPVTAKVSASSEEETVADTTLEEIVSLEEDVAVAVSAIVTLPPGVVGKTVLAVRDAEGTRGAFVRVRGRAAIPTLSVGDVVSLRGRVHREAGMTLSVNAKDVAKTGHASRMTLLERDPAAVTEDDAGLSVTVAGTVTAKGKGWVRLGADGDGTEIRGVFPKGVAPGSVAVGDSATMTGVVRVRAGKPEILMLEKSAFIAKKTEPKPVETEIPKTADETSHERKTIVLSSSPKPPLAMAWSVAATVVLGGIIAGYAHWRRKRFV